MNDMTVSASRRLIEAVEEARRASRERMDRDDSSGHEAWARVLELRESGKKEEKNLDSLHKDLWGDIVEKNEDAVGIELRQIANNALQLAMAYVLLSAEAGRAADEL